MYSGINGYEWFSIPFDFAKETNNIESYNQESCHIFVKPFAFKERCKSLYLSLANSIYFLEHRKN